MTLPAFHSLTPNSHQRNRLSRWLREWNLLKAFETDRTVEYAAGPVQTLDENSQNSQITAGEIRLLPPDLEPSAVRYIAILDRQAKGRWLVVPFGLLSEPATPEEVLTDREAPALRVLCPWNRFTMDAGLLQRCWQVGQLNAEEENWLQTTPPSDRAGPPLRHPLDPRWDYLEMESKFRQRVCAATRRRIIYDISPPADLLKAAEDSPPYGSGSEDEE